MPSNLSTSRNFFLLPRDTGLKGGTHRMSVMRQLLVWSPVESSPVILKNSSRFVRRMIQDISFIRCRNVAFTFRLVLLEISP